MTQVGDLVDGHLVQEWSRVMFVSGPEFKELAPGALGVIQKNWEHTQSWYDIVWIDEPEIKIGPWYPAGPMKDADNQTYIHPEGQYVSWYATGYSMMETII